MILSKIGTRIRSHFHFNDCSEIFMALIILHPRLRSTNKDIYLNCLQRVSKAKNMDETLAMKLYKNYLSQKTDHNLATFDQAKAFGKISTQYLDPFPLDLQDKVDILKREQMFKNLSPKNLRRVARACVPRYVPLGRQVIAGGECGEDIYILTSGSVAVSPPTDSTRNDKSSGEISHLHGYLYHRKRQRDRDRDEDIILSAPAAFGERAGI